MNRKSRHLSPAPVRMLLLAVILAMAGCEGKSESASTAPAASAGPSASDRQVMAQAAERLRQALPDPGVKVGETAPDFALPDADGQTVSLRERLGQGPVVLIFYRGGWCPFCNVQLKQFRDALPQIEAQGAQLIAISPQRPDKTREQFKQQAPGFDVLSDLDSATLKAYRLYYEVDPALLEVYKRNGIDLEDYNGSGRTLLPVSATFVIDPQGVIVDRFVDTDYTRRMSPEQALQALQTIAVTVSGVQPGSADAR